MPGKFRRIVSDAGKRTGITNLMRRTRQWQQRKKLRRALLAERNLRRILNETVKATEGMNATQTKAATAQSHAKLTTKIILLDMGITDEATCRKIHSITRQLAADPSQTGHFKSALKTLLGGEKELNRFGLKLVTIRDEIKRKMFALEKRGDKPVKEKHRGPFTEDYLDGLFDHWQKETKGMQPGIAETLERDALNKIAVTSALEQVGITHKKGDLERIDRIHTIMGALDRRDIALEQLGRDFLEDEHVTRLTRGLLTELGGRTKLRKFAKAVTSNKNILKEAMELRKQLR